jgi:hypothetical protein
VRVAVAVETLGEFFDPIRRAIDDTPTNVERMGPSDEV